MTNNRLRRSAITNTIWRFAERSGAKLISFIVSIIIARLLNPEDYGVVAIISVFTTILYVFVDSGLGNALIQKKEADELDFATVFYANIVISIVLYICLYMCAPLIARFYNIPQMVDLIRVQGVVLLISGIKNSQQAYVSKNLLFRKFFYSTLGGTIGASAIGIYLALNGWGVWALVYSTLFNGIVDMIVLWITIDWRPARAFSFTRLKSLIGYGSKLLGANLLQVVYSRMYDVIIGKGYSSSDLAFYNQGRNMPDIFVNSVDDAINSVMLPVLADRQESIQSVKAIAKRALKINMYIITPFLFGLAAIAEQVIKILYTEKWLPAAPYLMLFSIMKAFRPFSTINLSAIKALGRSDYFFKLELIKDFLGICVLLFTVKHGVMAIALGFFIISFVCVYINSYPNKKVMQYGFIEQINDVKSTLLLSAFMSVAVYAIKYLELSAVLTLCIQVLLGGGIYIGGSYLFGIESYGYIVQLTKDSMRKQK